MSKELYDRLQAKMNAELEQFRASLTEMEVQDVLSRATELAVKEQFVQRLESAFLGDDEIKALLKQDQPLQFMYENVWDQNHSSVVSLFSDLAHAAGENARQEHSAGDGTIHPADDRKYEITDIVHPQFPWLHRIRALRDVGSIKAGSLGGFVESEDNLSQQGNCWLKKNAISCEGALVNQDAQVGGYAVIRGSALIAGDAEINEFAMVEDHAIVMAGYVTGNARVSGNSQVGANQITKQSPRISGDAALYGEVRGKVSVGGHTVILPGMKIDMPAQDTLHIMDNAVEVIRCADQMQYETRNHMARPKRRVPER